MPVLFRWDDGNDSTRPPAHRQTGVWRYDDSSESPSPSSGYLNSKNSLRGKPSTKSQLLDLVHCYKLTTKGNQLWCFWWIIGWIHVGGEIFRGEPQDWTAWVLPCVAWKWWFLSVCSQRCRLQTYPWATQASKMRMSVQHANWQGHQMLPSLLELGESDAGCSPLEPAEFMRKSVHMVHGRTVQKLYLKPETSSFSIASPCD